MESITTANPRLARIVRHAAFLGSIIVLYFLIWGGLFYWMNDIESLDDDFGVPLLILSGFLIGLGAELLPTHRFWGGFFASAIFGVLVILWTSDERIVINIAAVVATFSFGLMGGHSRFRRCVRVEDIQTGAATTCEKIAIYQTPAPKSSDAHARLPTFIAIKDGTLAVQEYP